MKKIASYIVALFLTVAVYAADRHALVDYNSNIILSPETALGKEFMLYVRANHLIITDPLINHYMRSLGQRLLIHGNLPNHYFNFFVIQDSSINAFSGPAGNIGINSGLIAATETESELAAVLAHEIAHTTQKHISRGTEKEKNILIPEAAALAAAIALGASAHSSSAANAATGAAMAALAGSSQYEINFMRNFEKEADSIGMQTLYKSDFDPFAMPTLFARIDRQNLNHTEEIPAYLRNHPLTSERIAEAANRAEQFPIRQIKTNDDYYLMQARLKALTNKGDHDLLEYFKIDLQQKDSARHDAAKYGYALALAKNFNYKEAESIIKTLIAKYPNKPIYSMAWGEIKTAENKPEQALTILKKTLDLNPDYYPLIVQYGQTLISAKQYQNAEGFLQTQTLNYPKDVKIYYLLMQAQAKCGHLAAAYRSRAKMLAIFGDDKAAALSLTQADKVH